MEKLSVDVELDIESNYQCGVCGNMFDTEEMVKSYIRNEHEASSNCCKDKTCEIKNST